MEILAAVADPRGAQTIAFLIWAAMGAVGGFIISWAIFGSYYGKRQWNAVQAAKAQARNDAWIEFQQHQALTAWQQSQQQTPPTS